ncbi:MAG: methylenetetrahydrofolate reductase [NAD(P)H] [Elusimicrobia bacterium CG_4_10_14_0_2_um_filter_56_8]|nr:MAG: methylenetetrahydrofolate reductase [NAD(P)H] [Elusimicrobia bacterium CG1_02_56_21]PJA12223.1 MAG: methylenetetrahydrofolate reductase [NAD(P)H] [Elusimicrobia bacterium CG_4_10_14_0_2_um_filter_56_8]
MKVTERLKAGGKVFSLEFYPPKTEADSARLFEAARELKKLAPDFVSVTNSSSGTLPYRTVALSGVLKAELGLEVVAHLTCVAHTRSEISEICSRLKVLGIRNVLALRGDIHNLDGLSPRRDYSYASQLTADLAATGDFSIGGACYPEKHPEAPTLDEDISRLKEKIAAGAQYLITQLFFDNSFYFRFLEKTSAAGITVPILPGLMPITGYKQMQNFTEMMKVSVPAALRKGIERWGGDKDGMFRFSVDYASEQGAGLLKGGAPGLHLYTLNRSRAAIAILKNVKGESE